MKPIYYLLFAGALAVAASCHKAQYVEPTVERQGMTSLTAYFTEGQNTGQVLATLNIKDDNIDRFVIPVPYFFPEESDNPTTKYMSKVRVRAELAPDCKIDPPLTILDLNEENEFTFTDSHGVSRPIIITGKRTKSSTAKALSFNLVDNDGNVVVEGFINDDDMEIYLFSVEELNGYKALVEPWYHANVNEEIDSEDDKEDKEHTLIVAKNYDEEQTLKILAHDGKTEGVYTVKKRTPEKIEYGFNKESLKLLFDLDPVSRLGVPPYLAHPAPYSTLAYLGGYLVVGHGPEYAPIYINGRNGSKVGEIQTGGVAFAAVTNDEGGNMLLCNHIDGAGEFKIYRTKSVEVAPELFYTYNNEVALPLGAKIKVHGNIDKDARIVVVYEGVDGVTGSGQFLEIIVKDGSVVRTEVYDILSQMADGWGSAPVGAACIVPLSAEENVDGWFVGKYDKPYSGICWLKPELKLGTPVEGKDGNWNPAWMDCKHFNNANYIVHLISPHFPAWAKGPVLYLYDLANPGFSGTFDENSALISSVALTGNNGVNYEGNDTHSSGDVVIAPSEDGFKVFVYYYDHYSGVIGGYSADCVKK